MLANIIKEISNNIHINYGDSDKTPSIKPLFLVLLMIGCLYILISYF